MNTNRWAEYLEMLRSNFTPCCQILWLNEDESVAFEITDDVYDLSGSISVQMQNGIRRTGTLRINDFDPSRFPVHPDNIWFDQRLKINLGVKLSDNTPYYISQGVFLINNPSRAYMPHERSLTLNLVDKFAFLDGTLFGNLGYMHQTPVGTNIYSALTALLLEDRGNGKPLDPRSPILSSYYLGKTYSITNADGEVITYNVIDTPFTSIIENSGTYQDVLFDYAKMLGAHIFYDINGQLVVTPMEDINDETKPVQWEFKIPESKEFFGDTTTYGFEDTYNSIRVIGAILNGFQVSGLAQDKNINSPTSVMRIGAKFDKPVIDENYHSPQAAQAYAEYLLKQATIMQKRITFNSSPIYHLNVDELVTLDKPDFINHPEPYLVSGFTLPIGTGQMSITATAARDLDFG